ncbi:MAG TPA: methyltransferase domain-containing protein, partial [Gammaproteobacteria bacterium]|nr:methyltransferase domain-containing protein [Gammaproteobacteria bacterium]
MTEEKPNNKMYLVRGVHQERYEAMLKYAGKSILDVGCGSGAYVLKFNDEHKEYSIKGMDYQKFDSWENAPGLFSLGDGNTLKFEDNSFETLTLFEVLEHLPEPLQALKEYFRVCSKNLILTVPNCELAPAIKKSLLTYYHYVDSTHVNFFTMDSLVKMVEDAGFKVTTRYFINKISLEPLIEDAYDVQSSFLKRKA